MAKYNLWDLSQVLIPGLNTGLYQQANIRIVVSYQTYSLLSPWSCLQQQRSSNTCRQK